MTVDTEKKYETYVEIMEMIAKMKPDQFAILKGYVHGLTDAKAIGAAGNN